MTRPAPRPPEPEPGTVIGGRYQLIEVAGRGGMADVTQTLSAIEAGDPHAAAELLPLVYDELRKLAAARLADEKPGQTLQPTEAAAIVAVTPSDSQIDVSLWPRKP